MAEDTEFDNEYIQQILQEFAYLVDSFNRK